MTPLRQPPRTSFDDVPDHADGSDHEWWDADDDETGWHCRSCGVTVYPDTEPEMEA